MSYSVHLLSFPFAGSNITFADDDNYDDENGYDAEPESDSDDSDDDTVEECGDTETVEESCGTKSCTVKENPDKHEFTLPKTTETDKPGTIVQQENVDETRKVALRELGPDERPGAQKINPHIEQEGFLSKKPKKLKPIGRDVVAYITVEMNDIHSANDQAMLAGYTCSKIELVDFYITCLDSQDARYIVPHNKQYLVQMKNDLERLLAQILRIRPINRTEQIWRVNYPTT